MKRTLLNRLRYRLSWMIMPNGIAKPDTFVMHSGQFVRVSGPCAERKLADTSIRGSDGHLSAPSLSGQGF